MSVQTGKEMLEQYEKLTDERRLIMTVEEYRKKHKRCKTCMYAYEPFGLNAICKAKNKTLGSLLIYCGLKGMFCKLYKPT